MVDKYADKFVVGPEYTTLVFGREKNKVMSPFGTLVEAREALAKPESKQEGNFVIYKLVPVNDVTVIRKRG